MEIILFLIGGRLYTWIEILWRGRTHWSMFILGGICFVIMGLLNEYRFEWNESLVKQCVMSAVIITVLEFFTGILLNIALKWNVWDYSNMPFNLYGQICLPFFFLWILLSAVGITLDDWIRYIAYALLKGILPEMQERQKPRYSLWGKGKQYE